MKLRSFALLILFASVFHLHFPAQSSRIKYGHNWQLSAKLNIGYYRPQIALESDLKEPILLNDKISGIFIRPEIDVRFPIGLVLGIGYQNNSIKINQNVLLEDIQKANNAYTISEGEFSLRSFQSAVTPKIGWRFQFVERAYIEPHFSYVLGQYVSTSAAYNFMAVDSTTLFVREYQKGSHKLSGIAIGLDIVTRQASISSDGSGLWYGISLGWSQSKSSGNLEYTETQPDGTFTPHSIPFEKSWSNVNVSVIVGLLLNFEKKSTIPE
ncbi:MAG: hypothetical protein ACKVOK_11270 [Flavobacteriales bacterium]